MQQPANNIENGAGSHTKRKNPSTSSDIDTASSLKDRKHGANSNQHSHIEQREDSPPEQAGKKGRGSTSDKRKEQNRNAQRAFRERKEKVLKELEDKVDGLNKVNEQHAAENQNLRELVSRLQAENARLQESSKAKSSLQAPQSAFTFEAPISSVPNTAASGTGFAVNGSQAPLSANNGPASSSDEDILAFLNSAPPASISPSNNSSPFTLIQPSSVPSLGDDWAWNASAFGTEIPQSIAPGVTNIFDAYTNVGSGNSPANTQNVNSASASGSRSSLVPHNHREGSDASTSSSSQQDQSQVYNNMFSQFSPTASFNTGFTGLGSSNAGTFNPELQLATGTSSNNRRSSSGVSQSPVALLGTKQAVNNISHSTFADSPEATSSSNGSDRSEVQPPTPSSFFGNNSFNSNSWFSNSGSFSKPGTATQASPLGTGSFGQQSTAAFDTMDYRDPLFGSANGLSPDYGLNKTQNLGSIDNLDFSDFLVQSPPALSNVEQTSQPGIPSTGGIDSLYAAPAGRTPASTSSNGRRAESFSTSSVPGLSTSQSSSPSLANSSASSPSNGIVIPDQISEMFPYDIPYTHPLIQHVMPDLVKKAPDQSQSALFMPKQNGVVDIDALCSDMRMKATCKEVARERIAAAIQDDEKTLELYQQYLRESRP